MDLSFIDDEPESSEHSGEKDPSPSSDSTHEHNHGGEQTPVSPDSADSGQDSITIGQASAEPEHASQSSTSKGESPVPPASADSVTTPVAANHINSSSGVNGQTPTSTHPEHNHNVSPTSSSSEELAERVNSTSHLGLLDLLAAGLSEETTTWEHGTNIGTQPYTPYGSNGTDHSSVYQNGSPLGETPFLTDPSDFGRQSASSDGPVSNVSDHSELSQGENAPIAFVPFPAGINNTSSQSANSDGFVSESHGQSPVEHAYVNSGEPPVLTYSQHSREPSGSSCQLPSEASSDTQPTVVDLIGVDLGATPCPTPPINSAVEFASVEEFPHFRSTSAQASEHEQHSPGSSWSGNTQLTSDGSGASQQDQYPQGGPHQGETPAATYHSQSNGSPTSASGSDSAFTNTATAQPNVTNHSFVVAPPSAYPMNNFAAYHPQMGHFPQIYPSSGYLQFHPYQQPGFGTAHLNLMVYPPSGLGTLPPAYGAVTPGFGPHPQAYGAVTPGFGPYPQAYGAVPTGFGPHPQAYGAVTPGFGPHPHAFGALPPGFGPHPQAFGTVNPGLGPHPQAFGALPPGFGPHPPVFGTLRPAYGVSQTAPATQVQPEEHARNCGQILTNVLGNPQDSHEHPVAQNFASALAQINEYDEYVRNNDGQHATPSSSSSAAAQVIICHSLEPTGPAMLTRVFQQSVSPEQSVRQVAQSPVHPRPASPQRPNRQAQQSTGQRRSRTSNGSSNPSQQLGPHRPQGVQKRQGRAGVKSQAGRGKYGFQAEDTAKLKEFLERYQQEKNLAWAQVVDRIWAREAQHNDGFWDRVQAALPSRDRSAVMRHCRRQFHPYAKRGVWTPDEESQLESAVGRLGRKWTLVGKELGRHPDDVRDRYRNYVASPDSTRGRWSEGDLQLLHSALAVCEAESREQFRRETGRSDLELDRRAFISAEKVVEKMGGARSRVQVQYMIKRVLG